jgi:hypothetical protein
MRTYLTQSVLNVVVQNPIPTKNRQLVLYDSNSTWYVDGFLKLVKARDDLTDL